MKDKTKTESGGGQKRGAVRESERRDRQARSLRDNLKKRKAQVRSRRDDQATGG